MTATVEQRLQRLEDIEEIRLLLIQYGTLLDRRDMAAYASLFAMSGRWTGPYVGSAEGPAAILSLMEKNLAPPVGPGANHIMSDIVIEVNGDSAKAWSRWTYVVPGEERKPTLALSGHYDDVLTRENGRWRFKARVVSGDLPGVPDPSKRPPHP
jgi:hypothetical protein